MQRAADVEWLPTANAAPSSLKEKCCGDRVDVKAEVKVDVVAAEEIGNYYLTLTHMPDAISDAAWPLLYLRSDWMSRVKVKKINPRKRELFSFLFFLFFSFFFFFFLFFFGSVISFYKSCFSRKRIKRVNVFHCWCRMGGFPLSLSLQSNNKSHTFTVRQLYSIYIVQFFQKLFIKSGIRLSKWRQTTHLNISSTDFEM